MGHLVPVSDTNCQYENVRAPFTLATSAASSWRAPGRAYSLTMRSFSAASSLHIRASTTMRCSCAAREKSDLDLLDKAGDDGWKPLAITFSSIAYLKRDPTTANSAENLAASSHLRARL